MTDPWADPATPTGIDFNELKGQLLVIEVLSLEDDIRTVHTLPGERSSAIRANVTAINPTGNVTNYRDVLLFPKVLQAQLRTRIGMTVLGRLTQGEARTGMNAPWQLDPANEGEKARARAALSTMASPGPASSEPPF